VARTSYAAPGVYVEEVDGGTRPIEASSTSVAAFLGTAPNEKARPHEAVVCDNWDQFFNVYCAGQTETTDLAQAVESFFRNGGSRCYVVNVGDDGILGGGGKPRGIDVLKAIDEVAIVAAPGSSDVASQGALIEHCETMKDRVCILDVPYDVEDLNALTKVAEGSLGPAAPTGPGGGPGGPTPPKPPARKAELGPQRSSYAMTYFPWVWTPNVLNPKVERLTPPSGAMAGIFARTDATRGVHKAPANEVLRGVLRLQRRITQQEQELLNPAGINCLRYFTGMGNKAYGARTCSNDPQWRYINVRRVFCMVEESIARGTQWVVFEPNDRTLWQSIIRDVKAFLTNLWRNGALMGATPEQAFFVRCDEGLNTPEVIDSGMLIIQVGLAVVKPAEFVIFRIGQYAGGATTTEETA
jgi:phage tail sheath protein FI